jgi:hypothetical protein
MTPIFQPVPSLMFVGLEGDVADECAKAFPGMLILRVGHAAAAVERMLVTRPLVVVVGEIASSETYLVEENARDIQAEVVHASRVPRRELPGTLRASMLQAERNRDRPIAPPAVPL